MRLNEFNVNAKEGSFWIVYFKISKKKGCFKKRRYVRKPRYNLIVTDVLMPNMSGLELIRTLKEDSYTKNIPVLMISAMGTGTRMMLNEESQADGYLQKPFTKSSLLEAVKKILKTKRSRTI